MTDNRVGEENLHKMEKADNLDQTRGRIITAVDGAD
jgi:hypothetical protein